MKRLVVALGAVLLLSTSAAGQLAEKSRPPSVTASGEAVLAVEPDQAEIDIGVVTQAKNAPAATRENAEKAARVLSAIKKLLGQGDQVKTASYSLAPNFRYPQGANPELVGYTATHLLRIKTGALKDVGTLIDAAMQSGANTVNRLVFTLKDEQSAQLRALHQAAQKAKAKADEIADAFGLKVVKVLSVTEAQRGIRPVVMPLARGAQMEAMAAVPTPVEAGTIEVHSSVTLTGELGPK